MKTRILAYLCSVLSKKIMFCLNINKEAGIDQISAKFLKEAADLLAYPLSRIINL